LGFVYDGQNIGIDNYLLSLAIDSKADYLLTGDNDLLVLTQVGATKIIKYADFEKITDFAMKR
jgi:predicted nucleic acid-binding protein